MRTVGMLECCCDLQKTKDSLQVFLRVYFHFLCVQPFDKKTDGGERWRWQRPGKWYMCTCIAFVFGPFTSRLWELCNTSMMMAYCTPYAITSDVTVVKIHFKNRENEKE